LDPSTCLGLERCATSSGNPIASRSSKRGSEMAISMTRRSGTMSTPSTVNPGLDRWISSLRDSHASLSAWPVKDSENLTPEMGGQPPSGSFARYDPDLHYWRTFQPSLANLTHDEYSETWPRAGTMRDGVAWRLRMRVRRTSGTVSGLWPTPVVSRGDYAYSHGKKVMKLAGAVKFYTPVARMWKNDVGTNRIGSLQKQAGGMLNPDWVEWLMGWPIGWTDSKPLEMGRFQLWLDCFGRS
jgi:hypothetical protein